MSEYGIRRDGDFGFSVWKREALVAAVTTFDLARHRLVFEEGGHPRRRTVLHDPPAAATGKEGVKEYRVSLDDDGTISIWDPKRLLSKITTFNFFKDRLIFEEFAYPSRKTVLVKPPSKDLMFGKPEPGSRGFGLAKEESKRKRI